MKKLATFLLLSTIMAATVRLIRSRTLRQGTISFFIASAALLMMPSAQAKDKPKLDDVIAALCAEADRLPGDPSPAVVAVCGPFTKRVFITASAVSPNLGGLSGADSLCTSRARAAGLPGDYKAWLSDDATSARDRLTRASIPYVRLDGIVVANNFTDLIDGSIQAPISITENGTPVSGGGFTIFAWTGTRPDGTSEPGRNCSGWRDATNASSALAGVLQTGASWSSIQNIGCAGFGSDHLYCLQQ